MEQFLNLRLTGWSKKTLQQKQKLAEWVIDVHVYLNSELSKKSTSSIYKHALLEGRVLFFGELPAPLLRQILSCSHPNDIA